MMQEQFGNFIGRSRCECHECTQARWRMSGIGTLQGGSSIGGAIGGSVQPNMYNPNLTQSQLQEKQ